LYDYVSFPMCCEAGASPASAFPNWGLGTRTKMAAGCFSILQLSAGGFIPRRGAFDLVPKLRPGNPVSEAHASYAYGKPELAFPHSQAGAWERAHRSTHPTCCLFLVPKLRLGNQVSEAPASGVTASRSLAYLRSQAGAWEREGETSQFRMKG